MCNKSIIYGVLFASGPITFYEGPLLSARDLDIGPEGFSPRDDISRGLMKRAI
jgi:hypothetical protein